MCRYRVVLMLAMLALTLLFAPVYAQDQTSPLVVFVFDDHLDTASPFYTGAGGLSELEQVFLQLGARTQYTDLSKPLPDDARVIVIIKPTRTLSPTYLARIWQYLTNGNHLLLAINPGGYDGAYPESSTSGLSQLLAQDFGISLLDTMAVDPWFTRTTLSDPLTAYSRVYADDTTLHPIVEPLVTYNLPVQTWGARAITTETFGPGSYSMPLLVTRSSYSYPSANIFAEDDTTDFALTASQSPITPITVGALAQNTQTGSRIVLLGDSEIGQNGFGFTSLIYAANSSAQPEAYPLYPGNQIFIERLAAWLLELPQEDWPELPAGFTWLILDGNSDEWDDWGTLISDETDTATTPAYDITDVKAFHDDGFLYLLIETSAPPEAESGVILKLLADEETGEQITLFATTAAVTLPAKQGPPTVIKDGKLAINTALEIRLPLRLTGTTVALDTLCLCRDCNNADAEPLDCTDAPSTGIPETTTKSPDNLPMADGQLVTIASPTTVNLRTEPAINAQVLAGIPNGYVFEAVGRDESGDWIRVQDARYDGWIAQFLLLSNGDMLSLEVVDAQ